MPVQRLKEFLDERRVHYVTMVHSPAYTAQQVAEATHIPGAELAKTVILKLDGKMAMAVVPASYRVHMGKLAEAVGCTACTLAEEREIAKLFPGCEVGAMPPFGNLWGMPVYVSETLAADEQIAFSAGTHTEVMVMRFEDFRRLVEPWVLRFSEHV